MEKESKIYVSGHTGLVGGALLKKLRLKRYNNVVVKTREQLDLRIQSDVKKFFEKERPEFVFLSAAKVGGIIANSLHPAEFVYDNLAIQNNVIDCSMRYGVKKLLFVGSSCIYPKFAPQPIVEDSLMGGYLEPTNEAYSIAKIAGIVMCRSYNKQYGTNFISVIPTNLYGPGDKFDLENSHVIPGLILKFHEAKKNMLGSVDVWGTGKPKREFLYIDDLSQALVFLMENYNSSEIINVGSGQDISIGSLAGLIKEVVGYKGFVIFDTSKPDGTPRKLLDVAKINGLGWKATTDINAGLKKTYSWFLKYGDKKRKS